ncbi:enzymatic polyprotein endonuclease reverse [Lasius niger]|uniref:RNA-directed DNA polymerase n=1 Tax=Lasius niger TaxID=67767 RepID=A0A0J7KDX8_LASNI|nr:enzymatic polyprotein endonuclease reverse [Lasius niger]
MRWRLKLEEYEYTVVYKAGSTNKNADALSRNPVTNSNQDVTHLSVCPIQKRPRLHFETAISYESSDEETNNEPRRKLPTRRSCTENIEEPAEESDSMEEIFSLPREHSSARSPEKQHDKKVKFFDEEDDDEHQPVTSDPDEPHEHLFNPEAYQYAESLPPPEPPPALSYASHESFSSSKESDDDRYSKNEEEQAAIITEENMQQEPESHTTRNINFRFKQSNIPILNQDDNIVIFVSVDKHPLDKGAHVMQQSGKLPPLDSLMLGRARVYPSTHPERHLIVLPAKEHKNTPLDENIFNECIASLRDVITELNLRTISLCKIESMDTIPWRRVCLSLQNTLGEEPVTITVCHGFTSTPPTENRNSIIEEHHASAAGGHKGITKTYLRIKQKFSWHNMKNDIQEYIRNCRTCQSMKLVRRKTRQPMILTDTPGRAFDKVALDILGPFTTTPQGNTYVLTMQDLLTKYSIYAPIPDAKAEITANAFIKYFICRFGCPRSILTDQGRNFISHLMRTVMKKFRIRHFRTTAYHPQSNGSLERSHIVLVEYLKCFINKEEYWDELIERASFSYNTAVHEGTGYSPHELIFGYTARIPSSYNCDDDPETYNAYLTNLFEKTRDLQESARANLIKAKERSKMYYDKRVNAVTFKVNDNVFLINDAKTDKFSKEYHGPYRVIEVLNHENVKLKIGKSIRIVYVNRLRKAHYNEPG